jgi:carboxypeptidase family protein
VTIACESGTASERGPEVRTQTITTRLADGPARAVVEMHRFGGTVARKDGAPVSGAWVAIPELGMLATADSEGRFRFDRVPSGRHSVVVRAPDGGEAKADVDVPGSKADLVVGKAK